MITIEEIVEKEHPKMKQYLQNYLKKYGDDPHYFTINKEYAKSIEDELLQCEDIIPPRVATDNIMHSKFPIKENSEIKKEPYYIYEGRGAYMDQKEKDYAILYKKSLDSIDPYNAYFVWSRGLRLGSILIVLEFIDKHPEWSNLLVLNKVTD